jgi:hypothetical protein
VGKRHFGTVRQLQSGRWQARYRDAAGRQHSAPETFATKADASRWLSRVETELARGDFVDPKLGRVPFADWAEQYLDSAVHLRATTRVTKVCALRNHIMPALGNLRLNAITPLDIRWFVEGLSARLAPSTVRSVYGVLRAVLRAAVDAELLAVSPCRAVKLPTKRPTDKAFLTPD